MITSIILVIIIGNYTSADSLKLKTEFSYRTRVCAAISSRSFPLAIDKSKKKNYEWRGSVHSRGVNSRGRLME